LLYWAQVLDLLVPETTQFLIGAFALSQSRGISHPQREIYVRFLAGSSIANHLPYLIWQAFNYEAVEASEELSEIALRRLAQMDGRMTKELVAALNVEAKFWIKLLKFAKSNANEVIRAICYKKIAENLHSYLSPNGWGNLSPLLLEGMDLIEIAKLLDANAIQKSSTYIRCYTSYCVRYGQEQAQRSPLMTLNVAIFPGMTLKALQAFLDQIPMLNIENLDDKHDSPLNDVELTDGKGQTVYANSAILMRSSGYLKGLFKGGFTEGAQFEASDKTQAKKIVQLSEEDLMFVKTWLTLFKEPKRMLHSPPKISVNPVESIKMLATAKRLLLADSFFNAVDEFYAGRVLSFIRKQPLSPKGEPLPIEVELEQGDELIDQLQGTKLHQYFRGDLA
jgi:hypothetical protein